MLADLSHRAWPCTFTKPVNSMKIYKKHKKIVHLHKAFYQRLSRGHPSHRNEPDSFIKSHYEETLIGVAE